MVKSRVGLAFSVLSLVEGGSRRTVAPRLLWINLTIHKAGGQITRMERNTKLKERPSQSRVSLAPTLSEFGYSFKPVFLSERGRCLQLGYKVGTLVAQYYFRIPTKSEEGTQLQLTS